MAPDPYSSGDVGLIPGIILLIILSWANSLRKRKGSDTEETLFNIFTILGMQIVLFPMYFIIGGAILGGLYFVSPLINSIFNFDVRDFIKTNVWVDSTSGFLWTTVLGAMYMNLGWVVDFFKKPKGEHT